MIIDDTEVLEYFTAMLILDNIMRALLNVRLHYTPAERQLPAQASASSCAVRVEGVLLLVSERGIEVIYG